MENKSIVRGGERRMETIVQTIKRVIDLNAQSDLVYDRIFWYYWFHVVNSI